MSRRAVLTGMMFLTLLVAGGSVGAQVNLLPNGGFEIDSGGDGVADGWIAEPYHFSRQTRAEVETYIAGLPSYEELLQGERILTADGTVLYDREADGTWGEHVVGTDTHWHDGERSWKPEENWHTWLREQVLWQQSRFGEPPVPEGLDLGEATLVLSSQMAPGSQVRSEPIAVQPDTGYRLSFWVRTSGGTEWWYGPQVMDAQADLDDIPASPHPGQHYGDPRVLNSLPSVYWWGGGIARRYWARMELPFRTGPGTASIVIRLPYHHRDSEGRRAMRNESWRIWYDDLRLAEDATVLGAGPREEGYAPGPPPQWPAEAVERGFVAAPRPALPITYGSYVPPLDEIEQPLRLSLAAGETDSGVIFVRALENAVTVQAAPRSLVSAGGSGLHDSYGARFLTVRAAEMRTRFLTSKHYVRTPEHLLNSAELEIGAGGSGQFWLTITVPPGTPPGEYRGAVQLTRVRPAEGEESARQLSVPVVLTVRDLDLEEAEVAFFAWHSTPPVKGPLGPAHALPGSYDIYLTDQRRHGMNTVAIHNYAERRDQDGNFHITFNELDAMVSSIQQAGLAQNHPFLLHTWRDGGVGGEFCEFVGGQDTVLAIARHAEQAGWPEPLFGVLDEPSSGQRAARVTEIINTQYAGRREHGVRTAVAGGRVGAFTRLLTPEGDTLGDLYDVWIENMYTSDWPELHEAAARQDAELWMYNCWLTGAGFLQERFYAGLWTWRTGAKGNGVWSYGWYVRINDSGLPESKVAWEGRLAGVNDYRYLQTLENTIRAGEASGRGRAAVARARAFLDELRERVPLDVYRQMPGAIPQEQWAELDAYHPAPEIGPEDYDRLREECSRHIIAVRRACGL